MSEGIKLPCSLGIFEETSGVLSREETEGVYMIITL